MHTAKHTQEVLVNSQLIRQVMEYYLESRENIEFYHALQLSELEALALKHLEHWRMKLHELIFSNCNETRSDR